jgi:hypothetical protein
MNTPVVYKIEYWALGKLTALIEKMNRKSAKLGVKPLEFDVETKSETDDEGEVTRWLEVSFSGDPAKVAGWEFVGTIQHVQTDLGASNILRSIPGRPEIPEIFRTVSPHCGHCVKNRVRKDTFVLHMDGNFKQVGRNCLRDFLGHDPSMALMLMDMIREINAGEEGSGWKRAAQPMDVVLMAAAIANAVGFSKDNAGWAFWYLFPCKELHEAIRQGKMPKIRPTDADLELAEKAADWVRLSSHTSSFLANINSALSMKAATDREAKLLAWAVGAYLKEHEKMKLAATKAQLAREAALKRKEELKDAKHVGQIGERLKDTLTLLQTRKCGQGGYRGDETLYLHKFQTSAGDIVTWFTTSIVDLEEGQSAEFKFTVKEHKQYEGVPETAVTRVSPVASQQAQESA